MSKLGGILAPGKWKNVWVRKEDFFSVVRHSIDRVAPMVVTSDLTQSQFPFPSQFYSLRKSKSIQLIFKRIGKPWNRMFEIIF